MTFTPSAQSKVDSNNSSDIQLLAGETFTGAGTATTGYDTLIVTVISNVDSAAGGLQIQFSDDNVPANFRTYETNTVLATGAFTRTYLILKKWYRVLYTTINATTTFNLTTRISTNLDSSITSGSTTVNVFDNAVQASLDAFGKARVSTPSTLLEIRLPALPTASAEIRENYQQLNSLTTTNYTKTALGTGKLDLKAVPGALTPNPNGYALSQGRMFITYQPGKSLLMLMSGVFKPDNNSYSSYVGLFDTTLTAGPPATAVPTNGVFLSFIGGVAAVNIASNGSLTTINQSDWNVDQMNGSGPSGLTLQFDKTQLFVVDLEWLGVGRVRFGFYAYGVIQYCHQIVNLNVLTGPYTPTINLPVTYLLSGTNASVGDATITQICTTVISEGGYNPIGRPFSANMGNNTSNQQTKVGIAETALIAITGDTSAGYYHQSIVPTSFNVLCLDSNTTLLVRLRYYRGQVASNVTVNTWSSVSPYSLVKSAAKVIPTDNNNVTFVTTGSIVVASDYLLGKGSNIVGDLATAFTTLLLNVAADANNTPDVLLLTAQLVGSAGGTTADVWGSIGWQEVY